MNKKYFIDTSVLIENINYLDGKDFIISKYTFNTLDKLKYECLSMNQDMVNRIKIIEKYLVMHSYEVVDVVNDINDFKILGDTYLYLQCIHVILEKYSNVVFATCDILKYNEIKGRKDLGIKVEWAKESTLLDYSGYKEVVMDDDSMAYFYNHKEENIYDLINNEYLIIFDNTNKPVDVYRWDGHSHVPLKIDSIKSKMYGTVKPYKGDIYQRCLFDSFATNKITMVHSKAGTGKTYCAIGYLLYLLEKNEIDKIIVFANATPTLNTARLGFYPGTRDEKILESSLGNILSSKLGDISQVERMINDRKLVLIPMCDIRGYDTTGMKAGVLITEAQNMDVYLMKLALQRIGEDSICIIDGDYNAQVDNAQYSGVKNGMRRLSEVFRGHDIYGEVMLKNIYRSRIAELAELM